MKRKLLLIVFYFILFLFLTVLYFQNPQSIACNLNQSIDFDSQNFITWDFAAFKQIIPYKNIFYPYGFLSFSFKNNLIFFFIYIFITPFLLLGLFVWLKKIFRSWLLSITSFLIVLSTIGTFSGIQSFNRYGIAVTLGLFISYFFVSNKIQKKQFAILLGSINGLIMSMVTDQGIALSVVTIMLFTSQIGIRVLHQHKKVCNAIGDSIKTGLYYLFGYFLGLTPFLLYLQQFQAVGNYFFSVTNLISMADYAKIPFLPYLFSNENLLILNSLFFGVLTVSYKFFSRKNNIDLYLFYSQITLISTLLLFESKNIIRPIPMSLIFIGILLLISFFVDLYKILKQIGLSHSQLSIYFITILCFYTYLFDINKYVINFPIMYQQKLSDFPSQIQNSLNIQNFYQCKSKSFLSENLKIDDEFIRVSKVVKNLNDYNNDSIFSFPSNPIFYILFDQNPAPYLNSYDGSPMFAQNETISYLKKNKVKFVIYDMADTDMDKVPYFIRASILHNYLISNYEVIDRVGRFLIMEKKTNTDTDFFDNMIIPLEFKNFLSKINLGYIPIIEGAKTVSHTINVYISFDSIDEMNQYLESTNTNLLNQMLVFETEGTILNKLNFIFENKLETTIVMDNCLTTCIINTNRLPAFYLKQKIKNITTNPEFYGKINIASIDSNIFW